MDDFFNIKNVHINLELKSKKEVFEKVFEIFKNNNAVEEEYLESMIQRDKLASVALGNYLILPHGTDNSQQYIKKNCVVLLHLKKPMLWDGNQGQIIFGLALKGDSVMDFIQLAGISFGDIDAVEQLLHKRNLTKEDLYNFVAENKF